MKQTLRAVFIVWVSLFSFSMVQAFDYNANEGSIIAAKSVNTDFPQGDLQGVENDINSVVFYPNPVKDFLTVRYPKKGTYTVTIYNIIGDKVLTKSTLDDNEIRLDVTELQNGLYFISYEYGGKVLTKRFSKVL